MRIVAIGVVMALLAGCSYLPGNTALPAPLPVLAQQQNMPQLALLDSVLNDHFAASIADGQTTCVSVHDGRSEAALSNVEEAALMERHASLAPLTRCSQQDGRWIDADDEAAAEATLINLHSFTCATATNCSGWASVQTGAAGAQSERYSMEWVDDAWRFSRDPRLLLER